MQQKSAISIVFSLLLIVVAAVATAIATLPAQAGEALSRVQESGRLVVGTAGNMPPMTLQLESGKAVGLDMDIAKLMAQTMGVELVTKVMSFDKLLPAVRSGEVDLAISNITMTPDRNLQVAFVGPYLISGKCVVTKEEKLAQSEKVVEFNTPETRLAVLKGSTSELFVQEVLPKATVVTVDDIVSGAMMVEKGEVGGLLTEYPMCVETIARNPKAGFISIFSRLTYDPIGIALPGEDAHFINWTQNFLNRLENTRLFDALRKKWLGEMTLQLKEKPATEAEAPPASEPTEQGQAKEPAAGQ